MERRVASDYPQELLDLFLDRAGKFAVTGVGAHPRVLQKTPPVTCLHRLFNR
jgi:hypothetical protein